MVYELEELDAEQQVRQRVGDGHADLQLFYQDRRRRAICCLLFPFAARETFDFMMELRESPKWLSTVEKMNLDGEHKKKEMFDWQLLTLSIQSNQSSKLIESLKEKIHDGSFEEGKVALVQRLFSIAQLPQVLAHCQGRGEHYLAQSSFKGWSRSSDSVNQLTSCWVDLDYYKPGAVAPEILAGLNDDQEAAAMILEKCTEGGRDCVTGVQMQILPTLIVRSGRGLYIKWVFADFLPGVARTRWQHCQNKLIEIFKDFGADPQAKDAARVLRIVGSVNSKTGTHVRVLYKRDAIHFDVLADALLEQKRLSQCDREAVKLLGIKYNKDQAERVENGLPLYVKKREFRGTSWVSMICDRLPNLIEILSAGEGIQGRMEAVTWITMYYRLMDKRIDHEAEYVQQVKELAARMGADVDQLLGQVKNIFTRWQRGITLHHMKKSTIRQKLNLDADRDAAILAQIPWLLDKNIEIKTPEKSRVLVQKNLKYQQQRARLLERSGLSLNDIAAQLEVSTKTAKRWLVATAR